MISMLSSNLCTHLSQLLPSRSQRERTSLNAAPVCDPNHDQGGFAADCSPTSVQLGLIIIAIGFGFRELPHVVSSQRVEDRRSVYLSNHPLAAAAVMEFLIRFDGPHQCNLQTNCADLRIRYLAQVLLSSKVHILDLSLRNPQLKPHSYLASYHAWQPSCACHHLVVHFAQANLGCKVRGVPRSLKRAFHDPHQELPSLLQGSSSFLNFELI